MPRSRRHGKFGVRVVLDTNILVQSQISAHGPANVILGLVLTRSLTFIASERIFEEYVDVLERTKFGFHRTDIDHFLKHLRHCAVIVPERPLPRAVARSLPDPDDGIFLEAVIAGKAPVLVSQNIRHFPERSRPGIKVVTAFDFVRQYVRIAEEES